MRNLLVAIILLTGAVPAAAASAISPLAELVLSTGVNGDAAALQSGNRGGPLAALGSSVGPGLPAGELFEVPAGEPDEYSLELPRLELPRSDIPLAMNAKVQYFVRYFQGPGRKSFARWLSRSERYIPMMRQLLQQEGMPEDLVYLAMIESGFSPHAYSVASAVGPWQFMAGTARRYDLRVDGWIDERRDPVKSTLAAARYLKDLYAMFGNDWYLAAAGYNAGENKIMRAIDMYESRDFWELAEGRYLKRETKDYVPKLLAAAIIAKEPARYGFEDVAYLPAIEYDTVSIPSRTDLDLVAKLCDVPVETIKLLNPELRRWCTPPEYPDYQLKVPWGKKAAFTAAYAQVPEEQRTTERLTYVKIRARKKDTLASLAKRYGTTADALAEVNGLKPKAKLAGRTIKVPVVAGEQPTAAKTAKGAKGDGTRYYVVRKGDTLHSVAKRFKVAPERLASWNRLKGSALKPGRRLVVAKAGSPASGEA